MKRSLMTLTVALALGAQATTWYVATDGNDSAAGTSSAPFLTVSNAVSRTRAGDTVILAAGVYEVTSPVIVTNRITLRGATGDCKDVEIKNIKKNTGSWQCVFQVMHLHCEGARVESMTLSDGWIGLSKANKELTVSNFNLSYIKRQEDSFGSVVNMTDGVISNCVVQGGSGGCNADLSDKAFSVGIYMEGSDKAKSRLENCIIRNNANFEGDARCWGGGVCIPYGYKATISGCMISNNISRAAGGGIAVGSHRDDKLQTNPDHVDIINCVITDNYGGFGFKRGEFQYWTEENKWNKNDPSKGGTQGYGGGAGGVFGGTLRNCLIFGNHSRWGKGEKDDAAKKYRRIVGGSVARAVLYGCTVASNVWDRINGDEENDSKSRELYNYPGLYDCVAYNTISYGNCYRYWSTSTNYTDTINGVNNNYAVSGTDCFTTNNLPKCAMHACCSYPSATDSVVNIEGNVWEDPQFAVASAPDGFTFSGFSACIMPGNTSLQDTGLGSCVKSGERDLFGNDRSLNGIPDMGCLEMPSSDPGVTIYVF